MAAEEEADVVAEVAAPAILRRLLVRCLPLLFQQAGLERVEERELLGVGAGGVGGVRGDGRDGGGDGGGVGDMASVPEPRFYQTNFGNRKPFNKPSYGNYDFGVALQRPPGKAEYLTFARSGSHDPRISPTRPVQDRTTAWAAPSVSRTHTFTTLN